MFEWLGVRLRKLFRSEAGRKDTEPRSAPTIEQHAHAPGATQIGYVVDKRSVKQHGNSPGGIQFGMVGSVHVIHAAAGVDMELQSLQVQVMRMLDSTGDRRPAIEAFMQREFGTIRLSHLSKPQLVRVNRYCEVVESRRSRRSKASKQGDPFL